MNLPMFEDYCALTYNEDHGVGNQLSGESNTVTTNQFMTELKL